MMKQRRNKMTALNVSEQLLNESEKANSGTAAMCCPVN